MKSLYQRVLGELRAMLAPDVFGAAWADGHDMTVDDAIAMALAEAGER